MRLGLYTFCLTICVVASTAFISDGVQEFHFIQVKDGSNEYDFEWVWMLDHSDLMLAK